jgi:precorrin-6B C5,15-methyltransferase / cobalt-precorrin-6B C5,C15-methyltransferase
VPERITGARGGPEIVVVGVTEPLGPAAAKAVSEADLVVGSGRLLEAVGAGSALRRLVLGTGGSSLAEVVDALAAERGRVCVLASGDPGFFGITRALAARFGPAALEVHPAPSSVSLAFARLGLPWDDALIVSTLGRGLEAAATLAAGAAKAAVLCAAGTPPEALGRALLDRGARFDRVAVASGLGTASERVEEMSLDALAALDSGDTSNAFDSGGTSNAFDSGGTPNAFDSGGTPNPARFDPASVVVLVRGDGVAASPVLAWGRPPRAYLHRAGMITKSEVRAVVLARLELPAEGVLWDVGAGSGSVAVEAAGLVPGLAVFAVERDPAACECIRANAGAAGVAVKVVCGEAPAALDALPRPERVFVGGGGLGVLDAALDRLAPGGRVVATYAALDRAAEAWRRLGAMVQVSISRAEPLADAVRLVAADPVFVSWGPPR